MERAPRKDDGTMMRRAPFPLILALAAALCGDSCFLRDPALPADAVLVEREDDGFHAIFRFSYRGNTAAARYAWELGDGTTATGDAAYRSYARAGRYGVLLRIKGADGRSYVSPAVSVDAPAPKDVPSGRVSYMTLDGPGALFALPGRMASVNGRPVPQDGFTLLAESGNLSIYRADVPGYFLVAVDAPDGRREVDLFVSPIDSIHLDRTDMDWYRTQFGTITISNCGPTVAAMSIAWARGLEVTVDEVRRQVGWNGSGAVGFSELRSVLASRDVASRVVTVGGPGEILDMVDQGHAVGLMYGMEGLSPVPQPDRNFFGQYYGDHGGHYLLVKGRSRDGRWFVVYDPIPSDWAFNAARYADGRSMLGRNRYYPVDSLFAALRSREVLEVMR
jgi:hypothetical protein